MSYATQQDLIDRFGDIELKELADRDGDGIIDAAVLADALADADALIDSYIANRYDLPLATTPARLIDVASDIARYKLYKDSPLDAVTDRYKDAMAFLRDVSAGKASLDVGGAEPAAAGDTVQTSGDGRNFTAAKMGGF